MKKYIWIICCIFFCFCSKKEELSLEKISVQVQKTRYESDLILEEKYGYNVFNNYHSEEKEYRRNQSKEYYFEAMRLYQSNQFENAILEFENALKQYTYGVYYYHYGICFMNINDYDRAEKAFLRAIQYFDYSNPFYYDRPLYTFDNNGAPREEYFSYYNLACVYSIINEIESSSKYLIEALEYGYPYINHILEDNDLYNLFNSSENIKAKIKQTYDDGFVNLFSGNAYDYSRASEWDGYFFIDNTNIRNERRGFQYFEHARFGTYEVRNYNILINYNKETGKEGVGYIQGGGVMGAYEKYEPKKI